MATGVDLGIFHWGGGGGGGGGGECSVRKRFLEATPTLGVFFAASAVTKCVFAQRQWYNIITMHLNTIIALKQVDLTLIIIKHNNVGW